MHTKSKALPLALGITTVLLVGFAVYSGVLTIPGLALDGVCGGSALSLQQVSVETSNQWFPGAPVWLATFVANCQGQNFFTSPFSPSQVGASGYQTSQTSQLTVTTTRHIVEYVLEDQGERLVKFSPAPISYFVVDAGGIVGKKSFNGGICQMASFWDDAYLQACRNAGGTPLLCGIGGRQCYTQKSTESQKVLRLNSAQSDWSLTVSLNGQKALISSNSPQVKTSDLIVNAVGTLGSTSGVQVPSSTSVSVLQTASGSYRITVPAPSGGLSTVDCSSATYYDNFISCLQNYNSKIDQIVGTRIPSSFQVAKIGVSAVSETSGKLAVLLDKTIAPPFYPQLQFFVKAAFMGLSIPTTKPFFAGYSPTGISLNSGTQKIVNVLARNDGQSGSIRTSLTCPSPGQVVGESSYPMYVATGQTVSVPFTVTGISQNPIPISCSVKLTDGTDSSIYAIGTIGFEIKPFCTLVPSGNFVVDPVACKLSCSLQESSCTSSGKKLDAVNCLCYSEGPTPTPNPSCTNQETKNFCLSDPSCTWADAPSCIGVCKAGFERDARTGLCVKQEDNGGGGFDFSWLVVAGVLFAVGLLLFGGMKKKR